MTSRTWVGGHNGNDAGSADNWSPTGAPQLGDNLTLNLPGNGASATINGTLFPGEPLTINVAGKDYLNTSSGFQEQSATVNLASYAHLYVWGSMDFAFGGYAGFVNGGVGSRLTNYGTINLGSGTLSAPVNGDGTLVFHGYHNQDATATINAPVTMAQTVELDTGNMGLTVRLADVVDFHALVRIPPTSTGLVHVDVDLDGIKADGFTAGANSVTLTSGGQAVETLRVAGASTLQIAATYNSDATMLSFRS